ncbi:MAG: hypothetical protein ACI81S_002246 [Sphingobacteriales bacterium]|jgi:uncharacterized protein YggE
MKRKLGLLLLLAVFSASALHAQHYLTVTGTGKISVAPDQLTFSTNFTAKEKTYNEAMNSLNTKVNKLVEALKKAGVSEEEIKTGSLSINLWQEYNKVKGRTEVLGFVASHNVMVKTSPNKKTINEVFSAYMESGSDASFSMNFGLKDPDKWEDKLVVAAIKDAQHQANVMADAAGIKLGAISGINRSNNGFNPVQRFAMMENASMMSKSVSMDHVNPEDMVMTETVTVQFMIGGSEIIKD